ncbi:ATP-dependent DNA helicase [Microbulbifer sp. SA54]|uniref:ATP-dependent DNA helicase n=1 Tax=Microbulbifer sp. SA54 TaxID=3401577 RepID=UPI003AAB5FA0
MTETEMATAETLRLSVGELVAFACRTGDLLADAPAGPTAQEGIRAHQKLQKRRPPGSEAEYRLQVEFLFAGQPVQLCGRVDILHQPAMLEEIKTTYCPPQKLPEAVRKLHWAQLKIYGFCYLLEQQAHGDTGDTGPLTLQMLWYNLKDKKSYPEQQNFQRAELEAFAHAALHTYLQWHQAWQQHRTRMHTTAQALTFPFPDYRPGQRQLAVAAYRSLRDGNELLAEAPTGIGKTISTLFPAIKAMGEQHVDQLVYLTAKNSGRQMVRDTATRLHHRGLTLSLLEIQARDKTCACRTGRCSLDADGICPRTQGFFDRLPEARHKLLGEPLLTPDVVAGVADALQLCPFELSLQMLPWADLVVCDFNYVFDPLVRMQSLCDDSRRRALLVDEAHNLADRARDMHSAVLTRSESRRAAAACKGYPSLKRSIQSLVRALDRWVSERPDRERFAVSFAGQNGDVWVTPITRHGAPAIHGEDSAKDSVEFEQYAEYRPDAITQAAHKVMAVVSQLSEQSLSPPEEIREWLNGLYRYLTIESLLGDQHRCLTRRAHPDTPWQEQQLKLLCLSAADYLQACYRQFHGVILFSATLRPPGYLYQQLGLQPLTPYLSLPSPFDPAQMGVYLCPYVDTRYRARERATAALVDMIARVYHSRPGNYLVFFPSYRFLQQVLDHFAREFPEIPVLQQTAGASDGERAAFLEAFSENRQTLGFAIMGGVFGEGIDYVGEQLIGTIVVGVGLPQVNEEQELLRLAGDVACATGGGGNGFDIAYRYPGLTRVLQTAGRVIRSESDRGVVVLADARFADPFYRPLYPAHWSLQTCTSGTALSQALNQFWRDVQPG